MKSEAEGLHRITEKQERLLREGITRDPKTGMKIVLPKEDAIVDLKPEDHFWEVLSDEMSAAIPPDGGLPVPSEELIVFHRLGIRHPENQRFARDTLRYIFAGRAEGLKERFENPESANTKNK